MPLRMEKMGEAMAIRRTFKESLQKYLRSLEIGRSGWAASASRGASARKSMATATCSRATSSAAN